MSAVGWFLNSILYLTEPCYALGTLIDAKCCQVCLLDFPFLSKCLNGVKNMKENEIMQMKERKKKIISTWKKENKFQEIQLGTYVSIL